MCVLYIPILLFCRHTNDLESMDTDQLLPKDLNLSLKAIPDVKSTPGLPSVAGRDIYSLGSGKGRSGKNVQTPKIKPHPVVEEQITKNGEGSSPSTITRQKGSKTTPKVGSKLRAGKRKIQLSSITEAIEVESGDESEMEVDDEEDREEEPAKKGSKRKLTRTRKKVISSSESELSTDLSEDDELVALAAKLNRGAKSGQLVMNDEVLEDYFSAHSDKTRMATSDHTLAKLSRPKMDQQSMDDALSLTPSRFQHDRQKLYEE